MSLGPRVPGASFTLTTYVGQQMPFWNWVCGICKQKGAWVTQALPIQYKVI